MDFCCITVVFNPSGYRSRVDNYNIFRERLEKQKIKLITIELAFNDQEHVISDSIKLRSKSVMWQKERLINYAISKLPPECTKFAWLDADILLPFGWEQMVTDKLGKSDFVQLFQNVVHLKSGCHEYGGERIDTKIGIAWQKRIYGEDWLKLRAEKKIFHAEPGFGWAAKKTALPCLYDRLICGSGDNCLVDFLLNSSSIHHYVNKFTDAMLLHIEEWKSTLTTDKSVDYLPVDVYHLWHGSSKNRAYTTRDLIFKKYDYNPRTDIQLVDDVWEWATNKPEFHQAIVDYFRNRKEDDAK